ncbi:hypothetical protein DMI84_25160 (plasmid) [Escherichia coli]|nr:hypothetical protein DMI84_25160 [Escherichia coli]
MSTSAQKQSIENVSIPDVLNAGIPAIIQNIRAAQRRVSCDDLTARFFDNAVQSAEMLHAQLIDVYNAEADNHNSLVDAAENMQLDRHCCKVSDEAAFCLIQRPYISKTLLTRRISPRGSP